MKPALVFILSTKLGWKTYSRRLLDVIERRSDAHFIIKQVEMPRWIGAISRRNNIRSWQRHLPQLDPLDASDWYLRKWWQRLLAEVKPRAVHIAAHTLSQVVANCESHTPFSVALDHDRRSMEQDLPRDAWRKRDFDREASLLNKASKLYPMSSWTASALVQNYGVCEERIEIVPPLVTLSKFHPRQPAVPGRAKLIFVGNDFYRKGGKKLLEWVSGPLRDRCELHIVSSDPKTKGICGENIVNHGRVENDHLLRELLPRMDLMCLPTRSDMSPQVLAEAAAASLPTVATDIAGIPDLVVNGKTGLLCPLGDDNAFISAIARLSEDKELNETLGKNGRAHAELYFSAERRFNSLVDDMLHGFQNPISSPQ